jgi:uncharacterized spore protein YtfJ
METMSNQLTLAEKREEQLSRVLEKIYSAAQPGAVYSDPVTAGNYTIITASEIAAGGGFGSGSGFGSPTTPAKQQGEMSGREAQPTSSSGGGMGGGGGSTAACGRVEPSDNIRKGA